MKKEVVVYKGPEIQAQLDEHNIRFIAQMPDGHFERNFTIDHLDDFDEMKTLIVYCKKFFVQFGHGTNY